MEPQLRYCTSADGTRIAYYVVGQGPPRVFVEAWIVSMEQDLERPEGRAFFEALAAGRQLVWFDRRGVGASQRDVDDVSLEAQVADLAAVIDSLELERFDLVAVEDGAAVSVTYAAQHPEQVSRMVLWAPIIYSADVATAEQFRSHIDLIRSNWSMARRSLASLAFPSGPVEEQRWISSYIREIVSPEVAAKYIEFAADLDVRPAAAQVSAPALILQRRGMRNIPVVASRGAAAVIPNARFVALEGDVAIIYLGDLAAVLDQISGFLDEGGAPEPAPGAPDPSPFRTVLFTDVEGSTSLTQRLGDAKSRELLREHERMVRDALRSHGGSEVKTMGDGFMASFSSATRALECAIDLQRTFARHNESAQEPIRVRVGLNAGEPIAEEEDLFGTAVIMAARIAAKAEAGEILASNVVRELVAGKDFLFADVGETELRGFEDPAKLWELRWREEA